MPNKKIRRKRQKSLFSMTSADEYSLLDSGRISGGFDPTGLSYSIRPSVGSAPLGNEPNPKDPPSLDLLAEMIKEEIRQASSLKQALDRIGIETDNMSHRVTNLSVESSLNTAATDDQAIMPSSSTPVVSKKQVQFMIPDDIRFRWLGIFQQPQDEQESDGNSSDGGKSNRKAVSSSLLPVNSDTNDDAVVPDATVTLGTSLPDSTLSHDHADGSNMHSSVEHYAQMSADQNAMQKSPDLVSSAAMQQQQQQKQQSGSTAPNPTLLASSRPQRSTSLPQDIRPLQSAKAGSNGKAEESDYESKACDITDSLDPMESESSSSGFPPYTTNSSVEAVYGGSRSDTRESSMAQASKAQRKTDNGSTRLNQLPPVGAGPHIDYAADNVASGGTHENTTTLEQADRHLKPSAAQQQQQNDDEREEAPFMRAKRGEKRRGSPSFGKQQPGSSAFAQPTLATSKVTVPKRYSVSPPFEPSKVEAVAIGAKRASTEQNVSEQKQQQQQTSYTRHSNQILTHHPTQKDGIGRRRNSYDAPGFQTRGPSTLLTHEIPAFDTNKTTAPHAKPPIQPLFGGGLFRRVTTSSAHRKGLHNYQTPKSQDHISTEDHDGASIGSNTSSIGSGAAGLLGGTRDFFKHRLRSRTNSNQSRHNDSHPPKQHFVFGKQGNSDSAGNGGVPFLETIVSGKASDTVHEKARKRSDAEVKTRETGSASLPQQAHNKKLHLTKRTSDKQTQDGVESTSQPPLTLRTLSSESQSSWLAIQPPSSTKSSSSAQNDSGKAVSPLLHDSSVLTNSQRKSHDDVIPSMSRSKQSTYGYRQRARASSSDGHPNHSFRNESSMRLTRGQLELLRLPAVKDGEQAAIEGILGTRSKGHRGNGDVKPDQQQRHQHPPKHAEHRIAKKRTDSAVAEPDNAFGTDDRGFRPPPMPQMPPPPPPSLQTPKSPPDTAVSGRSSNTISKASDTDSIDYHMRRLKSDRKSRRSSFMTTISSMLGRKD
ncbi:hypothetical protein IW140_000179 [Coemansia sp. RSA 1813]|nr:hypothetical protein LPJ74_001610 [Coemansia sp. RSA 1843]KAJ2093283.1 hypothetical protein IW138_000576 [Coemansia sp. RSA 986]KAJ2213028.1 hypothetical protein EV179_004176 [Coemansia sp. RSA 487]KAJ2573537.1 hypothetical protein IW140_000179 [Coemansia sp. RSA 1813]